MATSLRGFVVADTVDVRFASSGTIVAVRKKAGDRVAHGEHIASLDRKLLQAELDRQLTDYEKVRAEFELFILKFGKEDNDDTTKFLRQQKQAALNASVKDVEIAKYKLDQADMISPVNGVIVAMEGLVTGLNTTPAASTVQIFDLKTCFFVFDIEQEGIATFREPAKVRISFPHISKKLDGTTIPPQYGKNGLFTIRIPLELDEILLPGMKGTVNLA